MHPFQAMDYETYAATSSLVKGEVAVLVAKCTKPILNAIMRYYRNRGLYLIDH